MQTHFSLEQLADPRLKEADAILRSCVHCGFCIATCPTYLLLGDERDSPRGRIYLIKDMLEGGKAASQQVALHIDRCLSCLSCLTTCPRGVDYMHLVDLARVRVLETHVRPRPARLARWLLRATVPHVARFRWSLRAARLGRGAMRIVYRRFLSAAAPGCWLRRPPAGGLPSQSKSSLILPKPPIVLPPRFLF